MRLLPTQAGQQNKKLEMCTENLKKTGDGKGLSTKWALYQGCHDEKGPGGQRAAAAVHVTVPVRVTVRMELEVPRSPGHLARRVWPAGPGRCAAE
jgi:hypothetical protein